MYYIYQQLMDGTKRIIATTYKRKVALAITKRLNYLNIYYKE